MRLTSDGLTAKQIAERVAQINGPTAESSVRSFLRLNTPELFIKERRGVYRLTPDRDRSLEPMLPGIVTWEEPFRFGAATLVHGDCFDWLAARPDSSIHAVVTDPPYGKANQKPLRRPNRPSPSTHPRLASVCCPHPVARLRFRRRACWDTGGPSMTNSKGIGIAVGFSLRLLQVSVPCYPLAK